MKGMLIKDFCILKLQKNAVLVLLAMCVVLTVFMKSQIGRASCRERVSG